MAPMARRRDVAIDASIAAVALHSGDVLDQPTFHRRYEKMPDGLIAELIDGIVYVHGRTTNAHATLRAHPR